MSSVDDVVPYGKYIGQRLSNMDDGTVRLLYGSWNGFQRLRNHPFFGQIKDRLIRSGLLTSNDVKMHDEKMAKKRWKRRR